MVSTFPEMYMAYFSGDRASSRNGDMFALYVMTLLMRSRIDREANSTQYTCPFSPTMSETWLGVVPEAAPKYRTRCSGFIGMVCTPLRMTAAILLLNASQTRYSTP